MYRSRRFGSISVWWASLMCEKTRRARVADVGERRRAGGPDASASPGARKACCDLLRRRFLRHAQHLEVVLALDRLVAGDDIRFALFELGRQTSAPARALAVPAAGALHRRKRTVPRGPRVVRGRRCLRPPGDGRACCTCESCILRERNFDPWPVPATLDLLRDEQAIGEELRRRRAEELRRRRARAPASAGRAGAPPRRALPC